MFRSQLAAVLVLFVALSATTAFGQYDPPISISHQKKTSLMEEIEAAKERDKLINERFMRWFDQIVWPNENGLTVDLGKTALSYSLPHTIGLRTIYNKAGERVALFSVPRESLMDLKERFQSSLIDNLRSRMDRKFFGHRTELVQRLVQLNSWIEEEYEYDSYDLVRPKKPKEDHIEQYGIYKYGHDYLGDVYSEEKGGFTKETLLEAIKEVRDHHSSIQDE
jgi:hypothetical protein